MVWMKCSSSSSPKTLISSVKEHWFIDHRKRRIWIVFDKFISYLTIFQLLKSYLQVNVSFHTKLLWKIMKIYNRKTMIADAISNQIIHFHEYIYKCFHWYIVYGLWSLVFGLWCYNSANHGAVIAVMYWWVKSSCHFSAWLEYICSNNTEMRSSEI